ncbi:uncharacterized protein LOC132303818 [Cornus florida]|uniref:uncharacterized protein LOC132303818 n=1 Tax=Cornus florida TaxID=4283 RepID=UPI00289A0396|nr:uncharacterized protein LOC132303818 [Cornus florida]
MPLSSSFDFSIPPVGIDGNTKMSPLAIAIVEAENRDSWSWFMEELMNIVGPPRGLTFMSDRQKGLLQTFEDVLEGADHRFCVRHMYENFKKKFKGLQLKIELWNAAKAYDEVEFNKHMQKIKDINGDAYDWLVKVPFYLWARAHFPTTSKCDLVINNMCESWNSVILKAREKPVITILEWIQKHLLRRFKKKKIFYVIIQWIGVP